jgi:hypothetical protein
MGSTTRGSSHLLGKPSPVGTLPTILAIEFLAIAFVEHQRSMEKDPEKKKYPLFSFFCLCKDITFFFFFSQTSARFRRLKP